MFPLTLALGASVAWGASDFLGGLASRRLPVIVVLLGAQVVGLALAATAWLLTGAQLPVLELIVLGGGAGIAELLGFACLYRGLAIGEMTAVAPLAALTAVLPVAVAVGGPAAVLSGRVASVAALALVIAARPPAGVRPKRMDVGLIAALGALDVAANLAYAGAALGRVDATVAVLGSLYPLTTVLLARALLHERLGATRVAGVVAVLGGVALISAAAV